MYKVVAINQKKHFILDGPDKSILELVNGFLKYLSSRNFSISTVRAYCYDLKNYCDWICAAGKSILVVKSENMLEYINWQKDAVNPQRKLENVYSLFDGRAGGYSVNTINRRLAAVSSFYEYIILFEKADIKNPILQGFIKKGIKRPFNKGLLSHVQSRVKSNKTLLKRSRTLPKSLRDDEVEKLIGSFKSYRDKAIALLMLLAGLRSSEVLGIHMDDVNIEESTVKVNGKGSKERVVPVDPMVIHVLQKYIILERQNIKSKILFQVLKGPNKGKPLTWQGFRTIFRYHRYITDLHHANPHKLRHTFGTNLANAGMAVQVIKELMGHEQLDSSLIYIHTSPEKIHYDYDKAVETLRNMIGDDL